MAQIIDPLPNDHKHSILCCYVNATSQIQIVRITNISKWYFERVVFPGQRLVFEALAEALLEIHTGMMASAIISDTIPCDRLSLEEDEDDDFKTQLPVVDKEASMATVPKSPHKTTENVVSFRPILVAAT